jgi:HD-like signal output (HDOD) protein
VCWPARLAKINGDEAMFAGLVHDLGVFYLMSRAANFPELVNDKVELHALLVGWHDNIGHALLSALGSPESVLVAVQEHETDREIEVEAQTFRCALRRQQDRQSHLQLARSGTRRRGRYLDARHHF